MKILRKWRITIVENGREATDYSFAETQTGFTQEQAILKSASKELFQTGDRNGLPSLKFPLDFYADEIIDQ